MLQPAARNTPTEQSKKKLLNNCRQSMVAAVYVDQRDKDRRAIRVSLFLVFQHLRTVRIKNRY